MPLSDCRVYDVEQAKIVGCIFYPMNGWWLMVDSMLLILISSIIIN
jgi:hypothetical protein